MSESTIEKTKPREQQLTLLQRRDHCTVFFEKDVFCVDASKEGLSLSKLIPNVPIRKEIAHADLGFEPDPENPLLAVAKKNSDSRGEKYLIDYGGKMVGNLIWTNLGYARGGHSHDQDVNLVILNGSGRTYVHRGKDWSKYDVKEGDTIAINARDSHFTIADTLMLTAEMPTLLRGAVEVNEDYSKKVIVKPINDDQDRILN